MSGGDPRVLVLGTRKSPLALAQARLAESAFREKCGIEARIEGISTTGDERLDLVLGRSLAGGLDKGLFTKELEEALLARRVDVAVHSLKDVPVDLPPRLIIAGVLPRENPDDLLISKFENGLAGLPENAAIGTSSERRKSQVLLARPDLRPEPIRGNVATRLRKLEENARLSGIVLARAGLVRLGFDLSRPVLETPEGRFHVHSLAAEVLPAPGQGIIGFEVRDEPGWVLEMVRRANDPHAWHCATAERLLLKAVGGGCHAALGVRTDVNAASLEIAACYFPEGKGVRRSRISGSLDTLPALVSQIAAELCG